MDVSARIKEVRKSTKLSQIAFGQRLGVSRDVINNLENGRVEPSEIIIKALCREFMVTENWLRTGNGEMLNRDDDELIAQLTKKYSLNEMSRRILEVYLKLPESQRDAISDFVVSVANAKGGEEFSEEVAPGLSDADIDAEVERYRHELEAEKGVSERSSVSGGVNEVS